MHPDRHPLFPTVEKAAANPKLVMSDHLPVMTTVPLGNGSSVTLLSLNILGPGVSASGFHAVSGWESDDEAKERDIKHSFRDLQMR